MAKGQSLRIVKVCAARSRAGSPRHTRPRRYSIEALIGFLILAAVPLPGSIKLQVIDGRPIADGVSVNGRGPFRFLVDTGANVNLIGTKLARKIGMVVTFQTGVESFENRIVAQGSGGNEILLNSARALGQELLLSDLDAIHSISASIQGVLGQGFLSRFDYAIDLKGKQLEFGGQDRNGTHSPFEIINGRMVISTSLGHMVLDSGAPSLVLFGVKPSGSNSAAEIRTIAGLARVGRTSVKTLIIRGRTIWHGDAIAISETSDRGVDGLLPLGLFKSVYVCNTKRYVVFE